MDLASILWKRLDLPGYDFCRSRRMGDCWCLSGTAIFSDRQMPCRLDYEVLCDEGWRTIRGTVGGWFGREPISVEIAADPATGWRLNGTLVPETRGCLDLDLSFTPSTNLIPVRRLALSIGESSTSRAAWLGFPELRLEQLDQEYRRDDSWSYHYAVTNGYSNDLRVDEAGFVTLYPGRWEALATAP